MTYQFFVAGEPQPYPKKTSSYRKGAKIYFDDKTGKKSGWMHEISRQVWYALDKPNGPIVGCDVPLSMCAIFRVTRPTSKPSKRMIKVVVDGVTKLLQKFGFPVWRPDVDNLAYGVTNALTGVIWPDDSQIVDQHIFKRYADEDHPAGVTIRVELVSTEAFQGPERITVNGALPLFENATAIS